MERSAYKVRFLLHEQDREMELTKLSSLERDVLYVIDSIAEQKPVIVSQDILKHEPTRGASRPKVYRALKNLLENNYIIKAPFASRGFFHLAQQD